MQPSEALGLSAQIAVVLAGFTGIVVAFATGAAHEWPPADRFRLRLLLLASNRAAGAEPRRSRVAGDRLAGSNHLAIDQRFGRRVLAVSIVRTFRNLPKPEFRLAGGSRAIFFAASTAAIAVTVLQVANLIMLRAFWPFFLCIVVLMLVGIVQFMRLVLHHPGGKAQPGSGKP